MSKHIVTRVSGLLRPQLWSQLVVRLRVTNEELTGLDDVLKAQEKAEEERQMLETTHNKITRAKSDIKQVDKEWEVFQNRRIGYYQSDERARNPLILQQLNQKEVELTLKKQELQGVLENHELEERSLFQQLSETMWDIHRKEIAYQERIKVYNSFGTTVRGFVGLVGAVIGFFGSSWIMRKKISKLESEVISLKSATDHHVEVYASVSSELLQVKDTLTQCKHHLADVHATIKGKQTTDGVTDSGTIRPADDDPATKQTNHLPNELLVIAMVTKFCCMLFITCKSIMFK